MDQRYRPESQERQLTREEIIERVRDAAHEQTAIDLPSQVLELYPPFIQKEVAESLQRIRASFSSLHEIPEHERTSFAINEAARLYDEKYLDHLTGLMNGAFVRKYLRATVERSIQDSSLENFGHIARIMIDLNGLKAINDLVSHQTGDQYLIRVADWLKGSITLHNLQASGADIRRSHESGDEFSVIIVAPPAEQDWDAYWNSISTSLEVELSQLDVRDLLPAEHVQKLLPDAPGSFTFRATAGIGSAHAEQAVSQEVALGKNAITQNDAADRILDKLVGRMLDAGDAAMMQSKVRTKELLRNGDAEDQTVALLLTRTEEHEELEKENQRLRAKIDSFRDAR